MKTVEEILEYVDAQLELARRHLTKIRETEGTKCIGFAFFEGCFEELKDLKNFILEVD